MSIREGLAPASKSKKKTVPPGSAATGRETAILTPPPSAAAPRKGMGWKAPLVVVLVGALVLAVTILAAARWQGPGAIAAQPQRPKNVAAPGLVESATGLRSLAFQSSGTLRAVLVEENQTVTKGQVIAELNHDDLDAHLAAAKAEAAHAQAQLEILQGTLQAEETKAQREAERLMADLDRLSAGARPEEVDRARAEAKASEVESRRRAEDAKRYADSPTVSSEQERAMTRGLAEIARAQHDAALAKLKELEAGARKEDLAKAGAAVKYAEAEVQRIRGTKPAQLQAAKDRIDQAQAKIRQVEAEIAKTVLRSPVDGVVVWKYKHAGETVGSLPPETVLTVADTSALRVRADVDEGDFARIKPGCRVRVRADAFGDRDFVGTVASVGAAAGQKRFSTGEARERHDVKVVETIVTFDQTPPFKLGLRVTTFFECGE